MRPTHKKILTILLLICIAGLCAQPVINILLGAYSAVKTAQAQQWDFNQIQQNYHRIFQVSAEIQTHIPIGKNINISFNHDSIEWITARYALYPHELDPKAAYQISYPGQDSDQYSTSPSRRLPSGALVFAPDNSFHKHWGQEKTESPINPWIPLAVLLLTVSLNTATGYLFLRALGVSAQEGGQLWFLGTSCLAGSTLHSMSVWSLLLFSVPLKRELILGAWLIWLIILSLFNGLTKRYPDHIGRMIREEERGKKSHFPWAVGLGCGLLMASAVILIALTPLSDWDALSKWVLKAKVLFFEQKLDFHYTHNNYYPLLWPIIIATQFVLEGKVVDMTSQWLSAVYFLLFMTQIWGGLKISKIPREQCFYILSVFLSIFFSYRIMATANAENMFLAVTAATIAAVTAWFKYPNQNGYGRLACFLMGSLCLVKFEGVVTVCLLVAGVILTLKKTVLKKTNFPFSIWILVALVLPLLWIKWTQTHGYMDSIVHFQEGGLTQKIPFLIKTNGARFLLSPFFTLLIILRVFSTFRPNKRAWTMEEKWHLWSWGGLMIFCFFGNAGQTFSEIQLSGTDAFIRLFLHTTPSVTLLIATRTFIRIRDPE